MLKVVGCVWMTASIMAITLGNFWFTYGIWPQSWWAFALFVFLGIANRFANEAILKEVQKD